MCAKKDMFVIIKHHRMSRDISHFSLTQYFINSKWLTCYRGNISVYNIEFMNLPKSNVLIIIMHDLKVTNPIEA